MKLFILVTMLVLLAGCASSNQTYAPDGSVAHSLNCSGTARNWGMCYEKAGEICGSSGYDVVQKSGEQGATVSGSSSGTSSGVYGSTLHFRTMTISCKN
jgi:hypothetical protein